MGLGNGSGCGCLGVVCVNNYDFIVLLVEQNFYWQILM